MGSDETNFFSQIPRLLANKRKKRGTIQDDTERGWKSGGLCGKAIV